ncbi:MAG: Maf family protein [Pseudomonadales bacterium]
MAPVSLVLASASPRRAMLLEQIGVPFSVRIPQVDETPCSGEAPGSYVERLAGNKAQAVARAGDLTLAADTVVVLDGEILGKPDGRDNAIGLLERLSGRTHQVITGVAITDLSRLRSMHVVAEVTFRTIDADEASAYWNTGEPADKAGGYGIQGIGGIFARSINGSYSAVVGLPLMETEVLLREYGVDTWRYRNG